MSLNLPTFEKFEEGSQIRKSIKNVKATIVEGYGRRRYKADFIKFLTYALASNDETIDHLENLFNTQSLTDEQLFSETTTKLNHLGKMINSFISGVEKSEWK